AWRVYLEPKGGFAWYAVVVDAGSGKLLLRANLFKYATNQGLVFNGNYPIDASAHDPAYSRGVPQTKVNFGYNWPSTTGYTIPAPYGDYTHSIGNNVEAREDLNGDDEGTLGAMGDGGPLQEFFAPFTDAYANSTGTTDAARIQDSLADLQV